MTRFRSIGRMYVVHRGTALLRQQWLSCGAMWGLEMLMNTEEYMQQYAAHALSHLEVMYMERETLLSIAASYEHASKRLRRWVIMRALRSYILANHKLVRSGSEGLDETMRHRAPATGDASDVKADVASLRKDVEKLERSISELMEVLRGQATRGQSAMK